MRAIRALIVLILILISYYPAFSQDIGVNMYFKRENKKNLVIPFKLVNNLIVVPFRVNNSETLFFILDSGVRTPIITELRSEDSISFKYLKKQKIQGLGEGEPIEVYFSAGNNFSILDIIHSNLNAFILEENIFSLSAKMGTKINGIIGYDVFNNFIVEIDYSREKLILHNPNFYKKKSSKRHVEKQLIIQNKKSYINTEIEQTDGTVIPVKLLVDTGSSMAIWLALSSHDKLSLPAIHEEAYLGKGLNGDIYGKQGRLKSIYIGKYKLSNLTVAFPDSLSVMNTVRLDGRNGSMGAEILRRFRVVINYRDKSITFLPNQNFRDEFYYNMSGLEVSVPYPGLPIFQIYKIKKGSPADLAGLKVNDQILSLNSNRNTELSLNDISIAFHTHPGRKIRIVVQRGDETIKTKFVLRQDI